MAEAVLTPQNKDLESGFWTRDCTVHEQNDIRTKRQRKEENAAGLGL